MPGNRHVRFSGAADPSAEHLGRQGPCGAYIVHWATLRPSTMARISRPGDFESTSFITPASITGRRPIRSEGTEYEIM